MTMNGIDKLRLLLPHWIEHTGEHAEEFRDWAERVESVHVSLMAAAKYPEEANQPLHEAAEQLK